MAGSNIPSYMQEVLTCSVCLKLAKDPQTLTQCLHNFCQQCLAKMISKGSGGVTCPNCHKFSFHDQIRSNFFVKDLVGKITDETKTGPQMCEPCPEERAASEVTWRCLDCRMNLCDMCKLHHRKLPILRAHRVAELTKGTDFVVDHMVFCTIHGDEPIRFFCKQCQMLLCIACLSATHKSHDIVTIEKALDELLPSIQSHLKLADTLGDTIEMNVKTVENKEKELKVKYKQCKDMIQQNADQRIAVIINEKEKWMANLTEEEEKQVQHLQDIRKYLRNEKAEMTHIKHVTRTCIENACHTILLRELVDGRLCEKLKKLKGQKDTVFLTFKHPSLVRPPCEKSAGNKDLVHFTSKATAVKKGVECIYPQNAGARYYECFFDDMFSEECFDIDFDNAELEIELPGYCKKLSLIGGYVWAPIREKKLIKIFSEDGSLTKTLHLDGKPTCIEQAPMGDILVACIDKGLFVINADNYEVSKIIEGTYSDICFYGATVFAWDYKKEKIQEFLKDIDHWIEGNTIFVRHVLRGSIGDTIIVQESNENLTKSIFIGSVLEHIIYKIDEAGTFVRMYGSYDEDGATCFSSPLLCGIDCDGQLLVADQGHSSYKRVTTEDCIMWNRICKAKKNVYDAKIDSGGYNIWCSQHGSNGCVLRKYQLSSQDDTSWNDSF